MSETMKITALAPWFGGNRVLAARVGKELGSLAWCGVPFAGGCPELPHIKCRAGVANDLHTHIVNLARCVKSGAMVGAMVDRLDGLLFHPEELAAAQRRCVDREIVRGGSLFGGGAAGEDGPDAAWAADYFVCCWMGRGGFAGKEGEFAQSLSVRFTSSGGSSAKRYASAVDSLRAWHRALRGWEFTMLDCFEFLDRVKDEAGHGVYADAPWPEAGEEYRHVFDDVKQERLARRLSGFAKARVVVRFGDHPLIRALYPESLGWTWIGQESVNQQGNGVSEVLIVKGGGA